MQNYTIYTDGSCHGNPGPGGWATIILIDDCRIISTGGAAHTTNNEMELTAFYNALIYLSSLTNYRCTIYTDSAYIINCLTYHWYKKWQINGWKTSTKQPVANKELWEKILNLWTSIQFSTTIAKVKGHGTNYYNNLADNLANKEANKYASEI